ncbi:MAG: type secretion system protein [Caulobacteraceae bacterium]|nr:type secretion system protein [Caulobacteraceae bacterium]
MDILEFSADPTNFLTAGVGVLTFATVVTLAAPLAKRDTLDTRMKAVANRREELKRRSRQALKGSGLRHADEGLYKKVVERLQLSRLLEDPKVVDKLAEAGYRGPRPVSTFYFFRFVSPFVMGVLAAFYLFGLKTFGLPPNMRAALCFLAFGLGFYAPNIYLSNKAQKRRQSIVQVFPDALDLLLICVEAGMSIEAALQKVSQEVGSGSVELAEELALLVAELSYLPERRLAYEGMARRVNYPGVKSVMTAMIQAERYGTPLGNALRVMAKENRDLRMSAAEKKAAALPAQLTVPMILFFLPVLFIVILGPAGIHVQDTLGHSAALKSH